MVHGLDTGFLVAAEVVEHTDHAAAQRASAACRSGSQQGAARQSATWTCRSGWGRIKPQGFPGVTAAGRPLGRQGWWLHHPDNESRAFVLAAVTLALTTWDVSFQLGVYGELFFEKPHHLGGGDHDLPGLHLAGEAPADRVGREGCSAGLGPLERGCEIP